jgi:tRNA (cytidine/uridine-2'-O-)-methyltransferase
MPSPFRTPEQSSLRLRAPSLDVPMHVALIEPEIPPNTGNIARLCAATQSRLHLVEPLGFRIDEHAVRRAGLDYWPLVDLRTHANVHALFAAHDADCPQARRWLFSGRGARNYLDVEFAPGDMLVFGKESVGLPDTLLSEHADRVLGIPTLGAVRSLNLANAVAIALYEALRQLGALRSAALG